MKFSKYLMMAGAAAMLTACSSEEPIVGPDQNGNATDGEVYAQFNIALASDGTRAYEGTANGTADEYTVDNGAILIFGIPNKASTANVADRIAAVYVGSATFNSNDLGFDSSNTTDELDAEGKKVRASFKKGTFSSSSYDKFYGVVVLNYSNEWLPSLGTSFENWVKEAKIEESLTNDEGHFVMTNAALMVSPSEGAAKQITVLSEIDKNKVKDLESQVTEDAATFTVQRVAAKVELANAGEEGTKEFTVLSGAYEGGKATLSGWAMDLTRKDTYPVQNVWDNAVAAKFTGSYSWFHSGNPDRCHWGYNRTYATKYDDADACKADFNWLSSTPDLNMDNTYEYIYENTMSNLMMTKGQTTRMVIKATFVPKDGTTGKTLYKFKHADKLFTLETLKEKVMEVLKDKKVNTDESNPAVTVSIDENLSGGWKQFGDVVTLVGDESVVTPALKKAVADAMGVYDQNDKELAVYKNGECYYNVYIKHFADEQEKNNPAIKVTPGVNTTIYKEEHIGRYGVVRNNWYEVTVNSISGPGLPENPEPDPSKPVDEIEDDSMRHMQVSVNMLNWAKRSQSVDL